MSKQKAKSQRDLNEEKFFKFLLNCCNIRRIIDRELETLQSKSSPESTSIKETTTTQTLTEKGISASSSPTQTKKMTAIPTQKSAKKKTRGSVAPYPIEKKKLK